ncbi:toll/interleukin-1 receptor domain-containing protein [Parasphingopyxis sp. CP4]|uniref:toll/interleukin-1 receptor domain-containing protein n=1 Tax=Parasphingopyxis sp. CP4 TaxID=2724527 RepID=UPI0015A42BF9|nr:toll/interleukin-1 receptor domain-containing protein [Parasphingopyxis sp. CP4]QLC22864.1 toll/interleukin-1 receptor domain-containing protein [Parasphingopyxis sp. CP4]
MASVFVSYSHEDEALRDEFEVHLSMLKRDEAISVWHDRRMLPGDAIDDVISSYLSDADIVVLLVSPQFLDSYYCYEKEMLAALDQHEKGISRVIAVILRPCDWQSAPFAGTLVAPTDGKPVTKWPSSDDAFLDVVQSIRRVLEDHKTSDPQQAEEMDNHQTSKTNDPEPRSSNLRIKSEFSEADKDKFVDESYDYIKKFFGNSLEALKSRNDEIDFRMRETGDDRFSATLYRGGKKVSECTIYVGSDHRSRTISYSDQASGHSNSYRLSVRAETDDYKIYLSSSFSMYHDRDKKLNPEGASELFWSELIEDIQ